MSLMQLPQGAWAWLDFTKVTLTQINTNLGRIADALEAKNEEEE